MPCIKEIDGVRICVYTRDHNPPHFHAYFAGEEELIIIQSGLTYIGKIPIKKRKKVIEWALKNQEYLLNQWNTLNPLYENAKKNIKD